MNESSHVEEVKPHPPETCLACNGTGVEEGREWCGDRCAECKGKCVVPCMCDDCLNLGEVPVP